ncbi:hypothetical protein NFO65_18570 [Neorhizobium galegae]|uniref:hypothetical protein n=1 Tax=Neorhizobium galegae TaxID=399 RepID=UPI002101929E|nr:hypothetical protein [Neorhizobium galegae]MCQ1572736.1 hypothetical protein [Neorhizobium galegae]
MTSCIASACLVDSNFDVDSVYFSLSRCGPDEESFNTLFQFVTLISNGTDIVRAYAFYCDDIRKENAVREHMNRRRLSLATLMTMFDLVEEFEALVHISQVSDTVPVDPAAVREALEQLACDDEHVRRGVDADAALVGLLSDSRLSITVGGAA